MESEQIQFCPSIYEHAARIIGKSPWEVSRDAELLSKAHAEAYRLYRHRPVVVGIDIYNLEAEAYGAVVSRAAGNAIPAIREYPCSSARELLALKPFDPKAAGRIPMVIEAAKCVHDNYPDADVRIPLSGPFSLAANLVGFENLLCEIHINPNLVAGALRHLVAGQAEFCKEVVRNRLDIAFFESAVSKRLKEFLFLSHDLFCDEFADSDHLITVTGVSNEVAILFEYIKYRKIIR